MNWIKRLRLYVVMASSLAPFSPAVNAAIIFSDNFQSDTAGQTGSTLDLDPGIGAGDIGGFWAVREPTSGTTPPFATFIQVLNDTVPGNGVADLDNYTKIGRTSSASTGNSARLHATGWTPGDTLNQLIQLDFSLWQTAGADLTLKAYNAAPPSANSTTGTSPEFMFEDLDTEVPDTAWTTVQIIANLDSSLAQGGLAAQTYTVSINGGAPVSHPFFTAVNQIQSIMFLEGANSSSEYVDNVVLQTIPEPCSMVLGVIGLIGFGLVAPRRNK